MGDPVEPGQFERDAQEITAAADELAAMSRELTDSGSNLGLRVSRAVGAVRGFADEVDAAGRGSGTE